MPRIELLSHLSGHTSGTKVANVFGLGLAGKRSFCLDLIQGIEVSARSISFSELVGENVSDFVEKLDGLGSCVLTEYETLSGFEKKVFSDYLLSVSMEVNTRIDTDRKRLWLVTSRKPISNISIQCRLPDLPTDPDLHSSACKALVGDFESDSKCPLSCILNASTRKLSLGQLSALVNRAKLLAMTDSDTLSCRQLSQAFNALALPVSRMDNIVVDSDTHHVCDFIFTRSSTSSLEQVIGLSETNKAAITSFLSRNQPRGKMLVITGPVGSGKTHVARTITHDPSVAVVRITSADILRSKIGETEKTLWNTLVSNKTVILEDIDKLFPADRSDSNGSVQRCLPVFHSFMDKFGHEPQRVIVGTSRHWDKVSDLVHSKCKVVFLDGKLDFDTKIKLIKSENESFDETSVTQFDLINLGNRSECIQYAKEMKFSNLRTLIHSLDR